MTTLLQVLRQASPCDKFQCWFRSMCKNEKLACKAFVVYVEKGRAARPTTAPTHRIYLQLFPGDAQLEVAENTSSTRIGTDLRQLSASVAEVTPPLPKQARPVHLSTRTRNVK